MDATLTNPPQDATLSQGYREEHPAIRHHAEYDTSRLGDLSRTRYRLGTLRDERSQAFLVEVEYPQFEPCLQEVERHRLAHLTQPNESNTFLHIGFLP